MMTAVPAFYTMLIVCMNVIAAGGGSNLYPPEQFPTFTEDDIKERIKGSKIVIISEQVRSHGVIVVQAFDQKPIYHRGFPTCMAEPGTTNGIELTFLLGHA